MIIHPIAFLGLAVVVIVTPGPDTALTVRNALLAGRAGGVATAGGVASGQLIWALSASAGIAAALRASQTTFFAVKFAGAAYLVYLGVRALVAAACRERHAATRGWQPGARMPARIAFRQGLLSNLGNPKMAVFFISLLPQFVSPHRSSFLAMLVLGFVFSFLTLTWLTGYAFVVAKLGDVLRRRRIRQILEAFTGLALIGLGVRLASERR